MSVDTILYRHDKKKIRGQNCCETLVDLNGKLEDYRVAFLDLDQCVINLKLPKSNKLKTTSKLAKVSDKWGVRLVTLLTMCLADPFFSYLGMEPRMSWTESENNFKWFMESISELPTLCVISTHSSYKAIKNLVKKYGANVNIQRPFFH